MKSSQNALKPEGVKYCIFETAWGKTGIAWSEQGLCALALPGPSESKIRAAILENFPQAAPGASKPISEVIRQIKRYFQGEKIKFQTRLDLFWATPFEAKVYKALLKIPYGETRSYADVAKAINNPGAARAVGMANARNRLPLIIPCHRVIAVDNRLGGFSGPGGVRLKEKLLTLEQAGKTKPGKEMI